MAESFNSQTNIDVITKMAELYCDLMKHDGYGDFRVEMKILRRQQKEVIIHCGKQHRFVVDYANDTDVICEAMEIVKNLEADASKIKAA